MDEGVFDTTELTATDPEMRQLLGLFDVPAFARRGHEMEFTLACLRERLVRERLAMLEMVRTRLRQWCKLATSSEDGREAFNLAVAEWLCEVEPNPPTWACLPGSHRQRAAAAKDLLASVERFNRRWSRFLDELNLDRFNAMIDGYNRYYVLEKECVFGSARLAARHFRPQPRLTAESLRVDHRLLRSSP